MAVPLIIWGLAALGGYWGLDKATAGASSDVLKKTGGKIWHDFTESTAEVADERGAPMISAFMGGGADSDAEEVVPTSSAPSAQFSSTARQQPAAEENDGGGIFDWFKNMGWLGKAGTAGGLIYGMYKLYNMFSGNGRTDNSAGMGLMGKLLTTTAVLAAVFFGGKFLMNQFNQASGSQPQMAMNQTHDADEAYDPYEIHNE